MSGCCNQDCSVEQLYGRQRGTLKIVLAINALMFLVIVVAALYAKSSALLADSLDNLGDALTYGLSIYAVSRGAAIKAKVALFKGILILLAALTRLLLKLPTDYLFQVSPFSRLWVYLVFLVLLLTQFVFYFCGVTAMRM